MERSIAARSPIGSLDILWRPLEALAGLTRGAFQAISRRRRLRIALLTALVLLPLLAGGWLLLRKSSFTAVRHVQVSGVHGPQAHAIDAALAGAAEHMSTLDVHPAALRAAVASFPVVRSVKAIPRFPHGLRLEVTEQPPVAALSIDGTRTSVAADGVVLGPTLLSGSLPALSAAQSTAVAPLTGQHVQGASLLAALTVLGAVPKPLQRYITRAYTSSGGQGLTVAMRSGLLVYFGDAWRPHAKWTALARVLAAPTSAGAIYVDVRVPERPAAGFSSEAARSSETSSSTAGQGQTTPESTVAALAAGLTEDTNGEPAATAPTAAGPSSTAEASTGAEATSEAATGASTGAESGSGSEDAASSGESESTAPGG